MDILKLNFSKSFLLKDFKDCPEGGGIYFHYIRNTDGSNRIIYVGECQSFRLRQEEHYLYYKRNKYLLFDIENGELNIKYIPDYDLSINLGNEFDILKEKTISSIYAICGEIKNLSDCNLIGIEGAIIIYLSRKSETRKFLLNTKTNYILRNTTILFEGIDINLFRLPDKIETPLRD